MELLIKTGNYRKLTIYLLLISAIVVFYQFVEPPEILSSTNWNVLFIFSLAVFLWVTQFIPLPATSLLVITLLIAFKVNTPEAVFSSFANSTVFFLIGAFMLGSAIQSAGLCENFVVRVLKIVGPSPRKISIVFYSLALISSFVIQAHVVVTVFIPVVTGFAQLIRKEFPETKFPKFLYIAVAWGAIIGSTGTLLGSGRAPLANSLFTEVNQVEISFLSWAATGIPLALLLGVIGYYVLKIAIPIDAHSVRSSFDHAIASWEKPRSTYSQIQVGVIFSFTLVLWALFSSSLGNATVAFIGVLLLIITNSASWKTLEQGVNWEIIFIFGGSIALGSALVDTKAIEVLTQFLPEVSTGTLQVICSAISIFGTEVINNTAVVITLLPIGLSLSESGIHSEIITYALTFSAGIGIITPMSTPGMAMILSTTDVKVKDVLAIGILFKLICFVVINLYLATIYLWS